LRDARLRDARLADEDFVYHQRNLYGNTDSDAEEFWTDIDDLDHNDLKRSSSGNIEESIINEPDWVSSILDSIYGDPQLNRGK
jgi:hypothetical protein